MATQVFLGQPPANIKAWILSHYVPAEEPDVIGSDDWSQLVYALESGTYNDNNPITFKGASAAPGSVISGVNYKISDSSTVPITWKILGYNASIPEYVKYRRAVGNGYKHVWVSSMKSGLIAPIAVGDYARTRTYDSSTGDYTWSADADSEAITAVGSSMFTYGNNCTYSVPTSITTAKGEYTFCGYNLTIQTEAILFDGNANANAAYTYVYFDQDGKNHYGSASIRGALNTIVGTAPGYWYDNSQMDSGDYTFKSLPWKMQSETGFLQNVAKTVNRTWVHGSWRSNSGIVLDANNCEHVVDKFWLLGISNVNCSGKDGSDTYFEDGSYDTSKFSGVFAPADDIYQENSSRIKNFMTSSGSVGSGADNWWLRSATSGGGNSVGYVDYNGYVSPDSANSYNGLSPAAQIG